MFDRQRDATAYADFNPTFILKCMILDHQKISCNNIIDGDKISLLLALG